MAHDTLTHLQAHHRDFAEFAKLMQATAAGRFNAVWWGVWQQYVAPRLPEAGRVVDLGCGPGGLLGPLRARHPHIEIVGVDCQPEMLVAARALAPTIGATIVQADLAHPLPLPDAHADAVTLVHVLHELPWPLPLLQETVRMLKPGGALLVFDWVRQPLRAYLGDTELTEDALQHFREHCLYTPDDWVELFVRAGLVLDETIGRRGGGFAMFALHKPEA